MPWRTFCDKQEVSKVKFSQNVPLHATTSFSSDCARMACRSAGREALPADNKTNRRISTSLGQQLVGEGLVFEVISYPGHLSWIDFDLGCCIVCPFMLGQTGFSIICLVTWQVGNTLISKSTKPRSQP